MLPILRFILFYVCNLLVMSNLYQNIKWFEISLQNNPLFFDGFKKYVYEVDSHGNVFLVDFTSQCIRKITPQGIVSIFAGSASKQSGNQNGTGTSAVRL